MEKIFQIYKITNLINNKIYIGLQTKNNLDYFGSGLLINKAIKKYGRKNFAKEIIQECFNMDELYKAEKFWIKELKSQDRNIGYNLTDGGSGGFVYPQTEETKLKRRKSLLNHEVKEEVKEKISIGRKKWINKQKELNLWKPHKLSEETKLKISLKLKGRISPTKGMKMSKETKQKISTLAKLRKPTYGNLGKHHSESAKEKIRLKNLNNKNARGTRNEETKEKMRRMKTLEGNIEKYGEELGKIKYDLWKINIRKPKKKNEKTN